MKKTDKHQLERETETLVSVFNDFCEKYHLDLFLIVGRRNEDIGYVSFRGCPDDMALSVCDGAARNGGLYHTILSAAETLELARKDGFDFEAVHEGRSTVAEQFRKIADNKRQQKD